MAGEIAPQASEKNKCFRKEQAFLKRKRRAERIGAA
jgi:hypothetical protein